MSSVWPTAREQLKVTTTNICLNELRRHRQNNHEYALEGTREYRLHHGSDRILEAVDADGPALSSVTVVPAPHGEDAGEKSIAQELESNATAYRYVVLNDAAARDTVREVAEKQGHSYAVVPPTHLFYVLYDNDLIEKPDLCHACEEMMKGEGWDSAGAIHEMWRTIPLDCSGYVDDRFLP
ncbi:hypothetical protein OB920_17015 [Halobacteria archaeon HArc-gm2]|nr:hypothetical protein [Halobacteria archaeon HArc-gm2]